MADKAELEKLDLNGRLWGSASARPWLAAPALSLPDLIFLPGSGNALGEEGCEQLQEVLDSFNMAKVLASLR